MQSGCYNEQHLQAGSRRRMAFDDIAAAVAAAAAAAAVAAFGISSVV